jgi:hypothetical protein
MTIARSLPLRQQLHRATVESQLHSLEIQILEDSGYAVVIENFYLQMSARRHDFRDAHGLKIDGITRLLPRLDGASGGLAFDLVPDRDKATTELFGILSKIDLIAFFDEDFAALVNTRRPSPSQIEGPRLRREKQPAASQQDAQSSRSAQVEHSSAPSVGIRAASVSRKRQTIEQRYTTTRRAQVIVAGDARR